jgi:hypothetical protein
MPPPIETQVIYPLHRLMCPRYKFFGFQWQNTHTFFQASKYNLVESLLYISYLKHNINCIVHTIVCAKEKEHGISYCHNRPYMVYKCTLHMVYSNKKDADIEISHVILEQFCLQLFSVMPTLKHQQNFIE